MMVREKRHRLPTNHYEGVVVVAFTACVKNRVTLFRDLGVVKTFAELLLKEAERFESDCVIYLFMPDHLHLILEGRTDTAPPLKAMNNFKQNTGYWLK